MLESGSMKEVFLEFGRFHFGNQYVISEINHGQDVNAVCVNEMIKLVRAHFEHKPFGWISHRINDYSIDPSQTRRLITETSVVMAAFVLKRPFSYNSFEAERVFYRIPKMVFHELDPALEWIRTELPRLSRVE